MSHEGKPCNGIISEEAENTETREPMNTEQRVPSENSQMMKNTKQTDTQLRANKLLQG